MWQNVGVFVGTANRRPTWTYNFRSVEVEKRDEKLTHTAALLRRFYHRLYHFFLFRLVRRNKAK
jgi:hypothetical protein